MEQISNNGLTVNPCSAICIGHGIYDAINHRFHIMMKISSMQVSNFEPMDVILPLCPEPAICVPSSCQIKQLVFVPSSRLGDIQKCDLPCKRHPHHANIGRARKRFVQSRIS